MQEHETAAQKPSRGKLQYLGKALAYAWRARSSDPEALEKLGALLEEQVGTPKENITLIKKRSEARTRARKDNAYYLYIDRYVTGAIAAVNLLLLQAFVSIGSPDIASLITLIAVAASLPLASGSLFYSFLKEREKFTSYGIIHNVLSFSAHITGAIAIDAAIWHVSPVAGIVFLCFAGVVYVLCGSFIVDLGILKHWEPEVTVPSATSAESQATTGTSPAGTDRVVP